MDEVGEPLYAALGDYSDWVAEARRQQTLYPFAPSGDALQQQIREQLGFVNAEAAPSDVRVERTWERDGVAGEEVSWSVGYGPRTHGWVLKPARQQGALPGVVALHCHSGFKYFGKEKIADGPTSAEPIVEQLREVHYEGRAFANELAKQGFVVLAHDTFLWGSRRFPLETMSEQLRQMAEDIRVGRAQRGETMSEIQFYNLAAQLHEHIVAKYCTLLGTTLAGVVSHEDRIAVRYLQSRPDVLSEQIGCVGLSGGGCRAGLLAATCEGLKAAVVVGMMSTYEHLLDQLVEGHTWMFFPDQLGRYSDWSDLVAARAPLPLLVQYDRDDRLFTLQGMLAAHSRITEHYQQTAHPEAYRGTFYNGPHKFDQAMQADAFAWLKQTLS